MTGPIYTPLLPSLRRGGEAQMERDLPDISRLGWIQRLSRRWSKLDHVSWYSREHYSSLPDSRRGKS